jgi:hypothetical protein
VFQSYFGSVPGSSSNKNIIFELNVNIPEENVLSPPRAFKPLNFLVAINPHDRKMAPDRGKV